MVFGSLPEIGQHHGDDVAGAFEDGNAAIGKLGGIFGFEENVEGVEVRIRDALLDHVHIEGHADGAPHIGNAIDVAGVPAFNGFQADGIEIAPIGQLRAVQRLIDFGFDEAFEGGAGLDHHIVAGPAGQHLGFHGLGRVIEVIGDLNAGGRLKILNRRLADIVGPVKDVEDASSWAWARLM